LYYGAVLLEISVVIAFEMTISNSDEIRMLHITIFRNISPRYSRYLRSGGTVNVEFPLILAASIHAPPPHSMPYNPTQLSESCKGYHRASTDLHVKYLSRNYVFIRLIECITVQIIARNRLTHASARSALPDMSGPSVRNRGTAAAVDQPPFLALPLWLSCYHYYYGVEPHKQKRASTSYINTEV
ncbi:hypothetical protein T4D_16587, partial [Trichinella pseudospiralis]